MIAFIHKHKKFSVLLGFLCLVAGLVGWEASGLARANWRRASTQRADTTRYWPWGCLPGGDLNISASCENATASKSDSHMIAIDYCTN
jgi:hypothetical protein